MPFLPQLVPQLAYQNPSKNQAGTEKKNKTGRDLQHLQTNHFTGRNG